VLAKGKQLQDRYLILLSLRRSGIALWCTVRSVKRWTRLSDPAVRLEPHITYNISIFLTESSCINTNGLIKRMTEICKGECLVSIVDLETEQVFQRFCANVCYFDFCKLGDKGKSRLLLLLRQEIAINFAREGCGIKERSNITEGSDIKKRDVIP